MQSHAGRELQKGDDPRTDHRRGFTHISRAGIPKRPLPNCQAGPTASSTPLFSTPRCRGVGTPCWAGPLTTSLWGLWVSGYLPRAMADRAQGRRPDNRPGGDDSDPGLASRRERGLNCHQTEFSRTSVDCINAKSCGGPKDPTVRREGTREPLRRGTICCCGLSWQPQARNGQSVGEDLTYVLTFFVYGRHSAHRQSAELPCCPSATWYPPCCDQCLLRLQPEFHFCCPYRDCIMSISR